ncbi:MAG: TIGR01906 family membrane protein [Anaerolineales bacterium]|nr:TIGR01906 family membrane protein [Anaerolineales bacterium]MCB9145134.1 TIGR01906 family membrane protein [Anaerolineales bacterium]
MNTKFLSYLISLLTPLMLVGFALRILLTPLYYSVEYNMPYFPKDEYGFTKEDRLQWAKPSVEYLVNSADISYLGDLQFEDGTPIYNERELSHMHDVKGVVQGALRAWYAATIILLILAAFAVRSKWTGEYLNGLRRGGWWMMGLAVTLGLISGAGILIDPNIFWSFFEWFHSLFFEGDTWLFFYSDTLIRLFPIRFWQDAVITLAVIALGGGLGLAFGIKET